MTEKWIDANVLIEEVDPLTYGELIAIHASVDALNVEGPYVFVTYDSNLYIGDYEGEDLKFYRILSARKGVSLLEVLDNGVINKGEFTISPEQRESLRIAMMQAGSIQPRKEE